MQIEKEYGFKDPVIKLNKQKPYRVPKKATTEEINRINNSFKISNYYVKNDDVLPGFTKLNLKKFLRPVGL